MGSPLQLGREECKAMLSTSEEAGITGPTAERLAEMDAQADEVISNWTFGALAANLLPPPFDTMAVGAAFAKMGHTLAQVYDVEISWPELKILGKAIGKGIAAVASAAYIGSSLLKYIP